MVGGPARGTWGCWHSSRLVRITAAGTSPEDLTHTAATHVATSELCESAPLSGPRGEWSLGPGRGAPNAGDSASAQWEWRAASLAVTMLDEQLENHQQRPATCDDYPKRLKPKPMDDMVDVAPACLSGIWSEISECVGPKPILQ